MLGRGVVLGVATSKIQLPQGFKHIRLCHRGPDLLAVAPKPETQVRIGRHFSTHPLCSPGASGVALAGAALPLA